MNGWMTDRAREISEGGRLARRAVEVGQDDALALARGGHALGFLLGELDGAVAFIDQALALDANLVLAWYVGGWIRAYRGEPDLAVEHLAKAIRLSPRDPNQQRVHVGFGFAHFLAGRYEEALSWSERAFRSEPDFLPAAGVVAASSALAGRLEQAREAMQCMRRVDPALRVSNLTDWYPIRRPDHLAK
jgi:tetratricopeptide (TPR) repeat protein